MLKLTDTRAIVAVVCTQYETGRIAELDVTVTADAVTVEFVFLVDNDSDRTAWVLAQQLATLVSSNDKWLRASTALLHQSTKADIKALSACESLKYGNVYGKSSSACAKPRPSATDTPYNPACTQAVHKCPAPPTLAPRARCPPASSVTTMLSLTAPLPSRGRHGATWCSSRR